jgi:hypothetical protein
MTPRSRSYAFNVAGGTKRGYAVLMVDGPGQGSALYEKGLVFRHDYEAVFGAKSAREYLRILQDYRVPAAQIAVPALVTAQPGDAETRRLYDAITSEKVLAEFNPDVGEWGQCEGVALSRTIRSSMAGSTGSWRADLLVIPRYPNSR